MFNYFFKCFCAKKIWQDSLYNILRNFLFYDTVNPAAPQWFTVEFFKFKTDIAQQPGEQTH